MNDVAELAMQYAEAKRELAALQDPDMPEALGPAVAYMIDHSSAGWLRVAELLKEKADLLVVKDRMIRELENQLKAADEGLLKCSDPTKSWQGIKVECKAWEKRAKTAEEANERLRSAIHAMEPFLHQISCEHLKAEEEIRQGKNGPEKWHKVSGWVDDCPRCCNVLHSNAVSRLMHEALGIYGDGSPREKEPA